MGARGVPVELDLSNRFCTHGGRDVTVLLQCRRVYITHDTVTSEAIGTTCNALAADDEGGIKGKVGIRL